MLTTRLSHMFPEPAAHSRSTAAATETCLCPLNVCHAVSLAAFQEAPFWCNTPKFW